MVPGNNRTDQQRRISRAIHSLFPGLARALQLTFRNYKGKDKMADATSFAADEDLVVIDGGGRNRTFPEWRDWLGKRAQAGKVVPKGFPRTGRFNG